MKMQIRLEGGKTAPRLLQDLINYDPWRPSSGISNVLKDVPFHDASKDDEDPPLAYAICRHEWAIKERQTEVLADFIVQYPDDIAGFDPCPSIDRPLHHFVHVPEGSLDPNPDLDGTTQKISLWPVQHFRCSAAQCRALLTIQHKAPRLKGDWISLLTDRVVIKSRLERAIDEDPEKFQGHGAPPPVQVLETLTKLLNNALYKRENKPYPRDGKSFLLNFGEGEQSADLLESLGFESDGGPWRFPQIESDASTPFSDPSLILLDDVREEVFALLLGRPDDERRIVRFNFVPRLAMRDLRLALGCDQYREKIKSPAGDLSVAEHPCYAGLGSVADFHDDLVNFAYERQIEVDAPNAAYYLECLQTIAEGRSSEDLLTKAAIEASGGRISLRDIRDAYSHIGIDFHDQNLMDETIIGVFQARLADAPRQEAELRRDLQIIASHRSSPKIKNVSAQQVANYEQALLFLDGQENLSDEFILTYYNLKVESKPSDEATARRAVALIADHRNSRALKEWLDTGNLGEVEIDIGQAYARLDITDWTAADQMIIDAYNVYAHEQPSQAEELKRALSTIAKHRKSQRLVDYLGLDVEETNYALGEWPVALNNIGNTCYLNSLLQFYFSIKPFRDLVLNMEEYKMPVDVDSIKIKRVGGRSVSRKEIERAQRTAEELGKLFNDLISSPSRSVRPNTELARLTLLTPKSEIARRRSIRQSMTKAERPALDGPNSTWDSSPAQDPVGPPNAQAAQGDVLMVDSKPAFPTPSHNHGDIASNSSSETLVEGLPFSENDMVVDAEKTGEQGPMFAAAEKPAPAQPVGFGLERDEEGPIEANAPSDLSGEIDTNNEGDSTETAEASKGKVASTANSNHPPSQPPPVPPRPKLTLGPDDAVKEAEFAAQQQDVNEIAYNVLNQLQCAIKPLEIDDAGEQIDQVKQLFYGKQKTHITSQAGVVRSKEEFMSDIKVNVSDGPLDIYAALDSAFDVEDVAVAGAIEPKYYTISRLPPVLQIHIQRGQYDPQTKRQFKSENHLELKETIYMDRYMETTDPELQRRREESWKWKRQLATLESRRDQLLAPEMDMNMSEVLKCACGYLDQLAQMTGEHDIEVPPKLSEALEKAAEEARDELDTIQQLINELKAKISAQFDDLHQLPYKIAAVFIHRGSSNSGHYWIYIFDFKANIWRNYNDERVTLVKDISEIFSAPSGLRPPTPYFVVYVQDDLRDSLVDPVCRNVTEVPTEDSKNVAMRDDEPMDIGEPFGTAGNATDAGAFHAGNGSWDDAITNGDGAW